MGKSGLLSSVAAAVFLTLASGVLLLVASSVVAFRGWPSVREAEGVSGRAHLSVARAAITPVSAPQRVVLAKPSAARAAHRRATLQTSSTARAAQAVALKSRVGRPRRRARIVASRGPRSKVRVRGVTYSGGAAAPTAQAPIPTATAEVKDPVTQLVEEVTRIVGGVAGAEGILPGRP